MKLDLPQIFKVLQLEKKRFKTRRLPDCLEVAINYKNGNGMDILHLYPHRIDLTRNVYGKNDKLLDQYNSTLIDSIEGYQIDSTGVYISSPDLILALDLTNPKLKPTEQPQQFIFLRDPSILEQLFESLEEIIAKQNTEAAFSYPDHDYFNDNEIPEEDPDVVITEDEIPEEDNLLYDRQDIA